MNKNIRNGMAMAPFEGASGTHGDVATGHALDARWVAHAHLRVSNPGPRALHVVVPVLGVAPVCA